MWWVCAALLPGLCITLWLDGLGALKVCVVAAVAALTTELACTRKPKDLSDGSALVTGLLIGLCLPPTTPWFLAVLASFAAIALAKHAFGGLGQNLFNPAIVGYTVVLVAFPQMLTHYDAVSGATALEVVAHREGATLDELAAHPALGYIGGRHAEWINLAHLLGGLGLLFTRLIPLSIPLGVLLGLAIPALLLYDGGSSNSFGSPFFHLLTGGTMLSAFFIATDPVTSPSGRTQRWIYALFIGLLTFVIRAFGTWPDGFAFAVLLGNLLVPVFARPPIVTDR